MKRRKRVLRLTDTSNPIKAFNFEEDIRREVEKYTYAILPGDRDRVSRISEKGKIGSACVRGEGFQHSGEKKGCCNS